MAQRNLGFICRPFAHIDQPAQTATSGNRRPVWRVSQRSSLVNDEREPRVTPLNARADPLFSMRVCANHFKRGDAVRYLLIVIDVL